MNLYNNELSKEILLHYAGKFGSSFTDFHPAQFSGGHYLQYPVLSLVGKTVYLNLILTNECDLRNSFHDYKININFLNNAGIVSFCDIGDSKADWIWVREICVVSLSDPNGQALLQNHLGRNMQLITNQLGKK